MNSEILTKLISLLETCAIWGVIYIISYFAIVVFGLKKNIVHQLTEDVKKLNESLDSLEKCFSSKKRIKSNIKLTTKTLSSFIKKQKNTLKLSKIYTFDNPHLIDAQSLYDEMTKCRVLCQQTMLYFNSNQYDQIPSLLEQIKNIIVSSETLLSSLRKEEENKKIKNL